MQPFITSGALANESESQPSNVRSGAQTSEQVSQVFNGLLAGPIIPALLKLAAPTVVVLVVQTFVSVIETYFVGFLGKDALAGVALVFPVLMLMTMMSNGALGGGAASAVARALGSGRRRDADALVLHAVVLAMLFGPAFTLGVLGRARAIEPSAAPAMRSRRRCNIRALCSAARCDLGGQSAHGVAAGAGEVRIPALVIFAGALIVVPLSPARSLASVPFRNWESPVRAQLSSSTMRWRAWPSWPTCARAIARSSSYGRRQNGGCSRTSWASAASRPSAHCRSI
jgi:hypothetical protein